MKKALAALLRVAAVIPMLGGLPSDANSGDGIESISVSVSARNLTSVAIKAIVSGDDDSSAVLRLFQHYETTGAYDSGMVMVRRVGTNIHEGRILWMTQGRVANFWIEATDATSGLFRTAKDTVSCAQVRPIVATGPVFYVRQADGSDSDNGTTPALAKLTIGAALTALEASTNGGANGGIIIGPGHYHERLLLDWGPDGEHRFIMGDGTNRDSTIICGANEHGEAGRYAEAGDLAWVARAFGDGTGTSYSTAAGVYKTYLPDGSGAESDAAYGDTIAAVVLGFGERLHRKTTLAGLFADSTGAESAGTLGVGEPSGWIWLADTLYVKRRSRTSPSVSGNHFCYRGPLIDVRVRNWHISRLTVRYSGGPLNLAGGTADLDPTGLTEGIVFATNSNASGGVVDSCLVYGTSGIGVYARYSSVGNVADSVTVANTVSDGLTVGTMGYSAGKDRNEEDAGAIKVVGSNSNVHRCVVREAGNGVQVGPSSSDEDSTWGSGSEVYGNTLRIIADDAIELDTGTGINQLVAMNTTDLSNSGVSAAKVTTGPSFLAYNTFTRFDRAGLKIGGGLEADGAGQLLLYQNTFYSEGSLASAIEAGSGGSIGHLTAVNNVFSGGSMVYEGPSADDWALSSGISFNYNVLDSASTGRLAQWEDVHDTFELWQSNYGQDANSVSGDVVLASIPKGRSGSSNARIGNSSRLSPSSIAAGAGRTLPGINSGLGGPRYAKKPNIGSQGCYNCYYRE